MRKNNFSTTPLTAPFVTSAALIAADSSIFSGIPATAILLQKGRAKIDNNTDFMCMSNNWETLVPLFMGSICIGGAVGGATSRYYHHTWYQLLTIPESIVYTGIKKITPDF